ncbi:MAG: carboxypeptidase-like regulatory domain-containing protein [Chitinophagales bacterium]|nr:carboxypeptidase-like regulatory domain-containing protein [Chitinophagales bacterium]
MRNLKLTILLCISFFCTAAITAQPVKISGKVTNSSTSGAIPAVSVTIKGTTIGTYTDDAGSFKLVTTQKLPITLVFSSLGFADKEVIVSESTENLSVAMDIKYTMGDDIVVAASRISEKIIESPVTIERVSSTTIKNAPAVNYYDILTNQKGVDVNVASLNFRTITTRGFVSSGNLRFNQIMDGMDNQAPGLNFAVGSFIGITELDVESMELLSGASSALYGPGGMNGTLLINSKNPFKYQGLSFQIKQGINHVDGAQTSPSPYYNWSVRWGKKINEKWAFKIGAEFIHASDWQGNDTRNYSRAATPTSQNGTEIGGNRLTDPNYDGVNIYGDETTTNLSLNLSNLISSTPALGVVNLPGYGPAPIPTNAVLGGYVNYAGSGIFNVSRTGYNENQVIDPKTTNFKFQGALHHKFSNGMELIAAGYFGTGSAVYTSADRYSLKDLKMAQYKLELKHRNWYLRAYTTRENAGSSFNATITTRLFNEAWKPSSTWYTQFIGAMATTGATYYGQTLGQFYAAGMGQGLTPANAYAQAAAAASAAVNTSQYKISLLNSARATADVGRPTGDIRNSAIFADIISRPIGGKTNGGLFVDKTSLNMLEGQYNLTNDLKLKEKGFDLLVGGNIKQYVLNSEGTLFADSTGKIKINEVGAYLQIQKKLFGDVLKLTASGRYDKNTNFKGRFTPRASAVIKVAKDHYFRVSYQTAYRFPSTQNQWINLFVSGGARLMGGLPQLREHYGFSSLPGYTVENVTAFGTAFAANVIAQGGNPLAPTPAQAAAALAATQNILQPYDFGEFKPESMSSIEVGYKGVINNKLFIDAYYYNSNYDDFIGGVIVLQSKISGPTSPLGLLNATTRQPYSISVNQSQKIKVNGWGISLDYKLPKNFSLTGNVFSDEISNVPKGFATYFNTPKYRFNIGINNSGLFFKGRLGGSLVYRWQDDFFYEGTFGAGNMPSYGVVDGMLSYSIPENKTTIKLGATNLWNKYYRTGWGAPQVGGLYYISFGYNL